MDESSIPHEFAGKKGYVANIVKSKQDVPLFYDRITTAATRAHTTLVAFIANKKEYQPVMPQFVLPKQDRTTNAEWMCYDSMPYPIKVLKNTGGWVNSEGMMKMLTILRQHCRTIELDTKIILVLDAANQHISDEVLNHAARLQIIFLLLPALTTWLLQPLDVYVFSIFKRTLHRKHMQLRMETESGLLTHAGRIRCLQETIQECLVTRDWSHTFPACGLSLSATDVKKTIRLYMPPEEHRLQTTEVLLPTTDQMILLTGRNRDNIRVKMLRPAVMHRFRKHKSMSEAEVELMAQKFKNQPADPDSDKEFDEFRQSLIDSGRPPEPGPAMPSQIAQNTRSRTRRRPQPNETSAPLHPSQYL